MGILYPPRTRPIVIPSFTWGPQQHQSTYDRTVDAAMR
jgi:hypothetical protein